MLDAVIIVLRETMEASLLVAFLFVYSNYLSLDKSWMLKSTPIGLFFALLVAFWLPSISEMFDGGGQELLFALVLFILSLSIQYANLRLIFSNVRKLRRVQLTTLFSTILILAISLEGAEIIIFYQSGMQNSGDIFPHLIGSALGLGIGVSIGAVIYYLVNQWQKNGLIICWLTLTFVSAGMISQAISYLMQADFIDSGYPIWDTSFIVDERSIFGQLLYALIGYEATPTLTQEILYLGYIFISVFFAIYYRKKSSVREDIQ